MQIKLSSYSRALAGAFLLHAFFLILPVRAQQARGDFEPRSAAFAPPFEEATEQSLDRFRAQHLESLSAEELRELQSINQGDFPLEPDLLSLDLFRSLAAYYH